MHIRLNANRVVFKWLSKVIGLQDSRQFFNRNEKQNQNQSHHVHVIFSGALSELQVITRNCYWFIALFAPFVIGRSNCFGFGFSTVLWKLLYAIMIYLLRKRIRLIHPKKRAVAPAWCLIPSLQSQFGRT